MSLEREPHACLPWWSLPVLAGAAPIAALAGAPLVAHALLHPAIGSFVLSATIANCAWFGPTVTTFATPRREVWLTIDDGPDPEDTPRILDLLDAHAVRGTFFVIGAKAQRYPELINEIRIRGHGVGNHSQTHSLARFWASGPRVAIREIASAQASIGGTPTLFRAPAGMANIFVHRAAHLLGCTIIGWSIRALDTRASDPGSVAGRVASQVAPGKIIMLHEGHRADSGRSYHPEIVGAVLNVLAAEGWSSVIPPESAWLSRGRPISPALTVSAETQTGDY